MFDDQEYKWFEADDWAPGASVCWYPRLRLAVVCDCAGGSPIASGFGADLELAIQAAERLFRRQVTAAIEAMRPRRRARKRRARV